MLSKRGASAEYQYIKVLKAMMLRAVMLRPELSDQTTAQGRFLSQADERGDIHEHLAAVLQFKIMSTA